jgi:hypothetical protein
MLLGTLEYMSPEQASGHAVDSHTDQFAVGLILSEMATGRPVFRRDTPAQVLAAVIEREPAPLHEARGDVPPALEAIVARCLRKDPARRFASTDELASEVGRLAGRSRAGSLAEALLPAPEPPRSAVSAEIVPAAPDRPRVATPVLYHVQTAFTRGRPGGPRVRLYDEDEIARLIHRGRLTGVELIRRDDEEQWQPLFESQIFRREVPSVGDPRDAARWRLGRALGAHFTGFFIVGVVMYATQGHLPFWMAIWGAVLGLQVVRTLPTAWPLLRRRAPGDSKDRRAVTAANPAPRLPAGPAGVPSSVEQEAVRVRALIEQRGGKDVPRLLEEVDGIVKLTAELSTWQADLEEQTSDAERAALAGALSGARAALERASEAQDRRLFQRQLDVLARREEAIAKAMRVLERLRVRRDLAEQQLKQLRLDLSRGAAVGLDVPELSSRLQYIRHEVDAKEEVEEIDAATD